MPDRRPPAVPSASVAAGADPDGAWVARVDALYRKHHGVREERADDPFARVRFRLPELSELWTATCGEKDECREAMRYTRVRQQGERIVFLPHCSALDELRLLDELGAAGPWKLRSGSPAAGKVLFLVNPKGQRLVAALEAWRAPVSTSERVWGEWLYARSVSAAFAASKGFDVPLLGGGECPFARPLGPCEAELATKGHPLAALRELRKCAFADEKVCAARQIVASVSTGYFELFCGRVEAFPLPEAPAPEERERLQRRRHELERLGIDVPRLLIGSAWAAYGHHVPQLDIEQLARTIRALDLGDSLLTRFREASAASDVSFANAMRADALVAYLTYAPNASDLLRITRRRLPPCAAPNCKPSPSLDALDTACEAHLLGRGDYLCAHG